ncbi:MAG TPA: hypothetical protein VE089_03870 [Nitrososphaeraceae archaeon]|nr:hypothetical protein [Nitrososphaeraceae archaeon]
MAKYNVEANTISKEHIKWRLCERQLWCPGQQKARERISFLDGWSA